MQAHRLSPGGELTGGFWFGLPLMDCTDDGLVDVVDYEVFSACLAGPGAGFNTTECRCFDIDGDGDISIGDYAALQIRFDQ